MSSKDTKRLEVNQYQSSEKAVYIIYEDFECLIVRIDGCKNNSENSSTTKVSEHVPSGFSMSTISSFRTTENKHDVYRGKDCIKKFSESLKENSVEIINFKKEKLNQESYGKAKICYICKEKFENKYAKDKIYCKVRDHCHYRGEYRGVAHSICNLKYSVPKKFIYLLIMELTMIFILSLGSWQKNLKKNLLPSEKTQKNTKHLQLR